MTTRKRSSDFLGKKTNPAQDNPGSATEIVEIVKELSVALHFITHCSSYWKWLGSGRNCWCALESSALYVDLCKPQMVQFVMLGMCRELLKKDSRTLGRFVSFYAPDSQWSCCLHYILYKYWLMSRSVLNKKLSYRKETVRLLHSIEIRVLHAWRSTLKWTFITPSRLPSQHVWQQQWR